MSIAGFPDGDLDEFVEALATRIGSLDKEPLAEIKSLINVNSLLADADIAPEWDAFITSRSALRPRHG